MASHKQRNGLDPLSREKGQQLKITVLGLGHLGAVASAGLALAGHKVTGVDVDSRRIERLNRGISPFYEPGLEVWLKSGLKKRNLRFVHRDEMLDDPGDVVLIATGTPPTPTGAPDLSQVRAALSWLKGFDLNGVALAMKSTVPPGVGRAFIRTELVGTGASYVSNPEFLREGQALRDWQSPDRIVLGADSADCRAVATMKKMYAGIDAPLLVTDVTSAEMIKYASNAFLATRISFINEIAAVCDRVGASIDAVSDGLALDPRAGNRLYAGVGYGGSCFPKDVRALDRLALSGGIELHLLKSVIRVNNLQRELPLRALTDRFGDVNGLTVGVLGLAFKPYTDDVREAVSVELIRRLVRGGATVKTFDPRANGSARAALPSSVVFAETPMGAGTGAHAVVVLTEWPEIVSADWNGIASTMRHPKYVFDGRNCLDAGYMQALGCEYVGVGRGVGIKRDALTPIR